MARTGNEPCYPTGQNQSGTGKTLRESFADSAFQGLLSNRSIDVNYPDKMLIILSKVAVMAADALIKELNKEVDDKKKMV